MNSQNPSTPGATNSSASADDWADSSFVAEQLGFQLTSFKTDPTRWNKDWEKALEGLEAQDAFGVFRPAVQLASTGRDGQGSRLSRNKTRLRDLVRKQQDHARSLWDDLLKASRFSVPWLLLEEKERKKHLMKGIMEACRTGTTRQDARALCPEVTVRAMLKEQGKAFINFVETLKKGLDGVKEEGIFFFPSEWWGKAIDRSQLVTDAEEELLEILTLHRNEFIAKFTIWMGMSLLKDLAQQVPEVKPVLEMMNAGPVFASAWSKTLASLRPKPIMRCENCAKSSTELEGNVKFSMCCVCNSKLNFTVHYCSQACQKQDWSYHKKHCGKERISKKLEGTANDPFWHFSTVPDNLCDLPINNKGNVAMQDLGFGKPDPSRPYSPALQRQVSLLTGDKSADYFLFDEVDRPIRVEVPSMLTRMTFRILRSDALSKQTPDGVQAIGEYLLKNMSNHPGLSRARILAQLEREYGKETVAKIEEFEKMAEKNGYEPGATFLEKMGENLNTTLPMMMNR